MADSCYASGWHENRGTRSMTVVRKNEKRKKKKKGKEVADSCYASGWHENRGTQQEGILHAHA